MRRFLKPQATEMKYGAELASVECTNTKPQLADKEMVIGNGTWKALSALQAEEQKRSMLGKRLFFSIATSYL